MTTLNGIPLSKPRSKTVPEPIEITVGAGEMNKTPNRPGQDQNRSRILPAYGTPYLDTAPRARQEAGQLAAPSDTSLADFSANRIGSDALHDEVLKLHAEVEAAERMVSAARLLPAPASWPQAGEIEVNANIGKPFLGIDENLEDDQPGERSTWSWTSDPLEYFPVGSRASFFEVPNPNRTFRIHREPVPIEPREEVLRPAVTASGVPPVAPETEPPSIGLSGEEREAFFKEVENFTSNYLDDLFEGGTGKPPEWVKDYADSIRKIDRDYPEIRPLVMAAGAVLSLPREILLSLTLDEEGCRLSPI